MNSPRLRASPIFGAFALCLCLTAMACDRFILSGPPDYSPPPATRPAPIPDGPAFPDNSKPSTESPRPAPI